MADRVHELVASPGAGRMDRFLVEAGLPLSRSRLRKLIEEGRVTVDGRVARPSKRLTGGERIRVVIPPPDEPRAEPEDIPVDVVYEDRWLAVVAKPRGLVVHPAPGHPTGTLVNALLHRCRDLSGVGGVLRPGIVHRLDKDTSGVMVVALSDTAYYRLVEDFKARRIKRSYLALVFGSLRGESGEMAMSIGRSPSDRKKMSTRARRGREAVTRWQVVERFRDATLVKARLETGRTHQIRVHFAASGHPVLGDRTYGRKGHITTHRAHRAVERIVFPRQMLHAEVLGFEHPATGQWMEFRSPLPEDMALAIQRLREAEAAQGSG